MKLNKRGVFFTFSAIFVIVLVVAFAVEQNRYRMRDKSKVYTQRIQSLNDFISDVEKDVEREMFIGGYRAILSLNKYIRLEQKFVPDLDSVFTQIFINGTYNLTQIDFMNQSDFNSWSQRVSDEAEILDIQVSFFPNDVEIYQTDPWSVTLGLNLSFNVTDDRNTANWVITKHYTRQFDIRGFEDPLYIVYTQDKVTNLINKTPSLAFVNDTGDQNDTTNLQFHLNNSYYIASPKAPSFLMRYVGNLSNSSYGIESLVNLYDLQRQGISVKNKTVVDYLYFGNLSTTDVCDIQNMPSWFRIDNNHYLTYELNELETTGC